MAIQKSKSLTLFLSYQLKNWPIWPNFEVNGLDWQCCLAGCSKRAPRILIFSIAMDTDNSFYVKFIATEAPTFFGILFQSQPWCVSANGAIMYGNDVAYYTVSGNKSRYIMVQEAVYAQKYAKLILALYLRSK